MKYRLTFDMLKDCTGKDYPCIHVIGGGVKDGLLCQMTASSCGVPVKAGPIEATVLGNIAVQLIAGGCIKDVAEARRIIANSESLKVYEPQDADKWTSAYKKYLTVTGKQ